MAIVFVLALSKTLRRWLWGVFLRLFCFSARAFSVLSAAYAWYATASMASAISLKLFTLDMPLSLTAFLLTKLLGASAAACLLTRLSR